MRLVSAVLVVLCLSAQPGGAGEPVIIRPVVCWSGTVQDTTKQKAEPDLGLITNQKTFASLWKAWREAEEVPQIDFTAYFVIVRAAEGRRISITELRVDEKGDAAATHVASAKNEEGFGYGIAVVPRAPLRTFGYRPLEGN